jgi:hypothetical protein
VILYKVFEFYFEGGPKEVETTLILLEACMIETFFFTPYVFAFIFKLMTSEFIVNSVLETKLYYCQMTI